MAFLRSSILFKNSLVNINHGTSYFITRHMGETTVVYNAIKRYYATTPEVRTLPLNQKLLHLHEFARKGNYVSINSVKDLLISLNHEHATPQQFWESFQFFGEMMSGESPAIRAKLAEQLWESMQTRHDIQISHYNAFLSIYVENDCSISMEQVMNDLTNMNLTPNLKTFELILKNDSQKGDVDAIEKTLNLMKDNKLYPNASIHNYIMFANGLAGNKEKALNQLNVMKEQNVRPIIDTYVTMLCVYAMDGDVEGIFAENERVKSVGITLQDKHFLEVIYHLAIHGHSDRCKQLYGMLLKIGYYKRLAANTINRLIEKRQDDVAFELFKTFAQRKSELESNETNGGFILEKMIKTNRSGNDITAFGQRLLDEGIQARPFHLILQKSNKAQSVEQSWSIIRALHAKGIPFTEHHFQWAFKTESKEQIQEGLREMIQVFRIKPSTEFLQTFILPHLIIKDVANSINLLLISKVPAKTAAEAVAYYCLATNRLRDAAKIINFFKISIPIDVKKSPLTSSVKTVDDLKWYVPFVHAYFHSLGRSAETNSRDPSEIIGEILYETLKNVEPEERVEILDAVLVSLVEIGVTISLEQSQQILNEMKNYLSLDNKENLQKLASRRLELKPVKQLTPQDFGIVPTSAHIAKNIAIDNVGTKESAQIALLNAYFRESETEKAENLIYQLKSENIQIPPFIYARWIKSKVNAKDINAAVKLFNKCKIEHSEIILQNDLIIEIMMLLIDNDQFNEALEFSEKSKRKARIDDKEHFFAQERAFEFLNGLARKGNELELNKIFKSLVENGHIVVTKKLLEPRIHVHLVNNDLEKAVDTFETLAERYNETPLQNILFINLIRADDMEKLQKVAGISSAVSNEHKCLVDMVFCYIECGDVKSASNILATPALWVSQEQVDLQCKTYADEGAIRKLEDFAKASENTIHFRRDSIFINLMDLYIDQNLPQKAIELWEKLQEVNHIPTPEFLNKLGQFLKSHKIRVPFQIPGAIPKEKFMAKLYHNDHKLIINEYQYLSDVELSKTLKLIVGKAYLKNLLDALCETGKIEDLERINSLLPIEERNRKWFNRSYAEACNRYGQVDRWLNDCNNKLDQLTVTEQDFLNFKNEFPVNAFCSIIDNNSELWTKFQTFAQKCADKNMLGPMTAIWSCAVIKGDTETGKRVWEKYIRNNAYINYRPITQKAFQDNNTTILYDLIEYLETSSVGKNVVNGVKAVIHSIHLNNGQLNEALKVAESLNFDTASIKTKELRRLKCALEAAGKNVPFIIDASSATRI